MNPLRRALLLLIVSLCLASLTAQAQTDDPAATAVPETDATPDAGADVPRVHVVEDGENMTYIASLYGTTVEALLIANNLSEESILYVGQPLIIPGETGEIVVAVVTLQLGDTLAGLAAAYNTTVEAIADANRILNPDRLIAGRQITVVSRTGSAEPQQIMGRPHVVRAGETLLLLAARYNLSPAVLAAANELAYPWRLFAGQRLRIPGGDEPYRMLAGEWTDVRVRPLPAVQGETVAIYVENILSGVPSGRLGGQPVRFAPHEDGYVALVGLDAFTEPGIYTLELEGSGERPWRPLQQALQVVAGNYAPPEAPQYITVTEELSALLEPEVRSEEDAFLGTIYGRYSQPQQWSGLFQSPVTTTVVTAGYGDARSYNSRPVEIFHSGVDYAGAAGTPVLASAAGTVVFNDATELRGNVIIVDHGLGVMTGYYHLASSLVSVGDAVLPGEQIGIMGTTGLSSGVHLHWELRINNVPVNGFQWLRDSFP